MVENLPLQIIASRQKQASGPALPSRDLFLSGIQAIERYNLRQVSHITLSRPDRSCTGGVWCEFEGRMIGY